jgi:glutamate synthase (NADPH/NADH) small chain
MEKFNLDRRLEQMVTEGVIFQANANIGENVSVDLLKQEFDAMMLTAGACAPRDLPVPGRKLDGVHFAMNYLTLQNKKCEGDEIPELENISAKGKHVVILGGGDTGADCLGTANRQGAISVHQLEIMPKPPETRSDNNPWPEWPQIYRVASAHEEGVERVYSVSTKSFIDNGAGKVKELELIKVETKLVDGKLSFEEIPGSEFSIPCELVLLAMGFVGPEKPGMLEQLDVKLTDNGNVDRDKDWMTNVPGVFTAGDMQRGQSLIVWAIADGRSAARGVDKYLMGSSDLPAPV